jgi:hypothetical protein
MYVAIMALIVVCYVGVAVYDVRMKGRIMPKHRRMFKCWFEHNVKTNFYTATVEIWDGVSGHVIFHWECTFAWEDQFNVEAMLHDVVKDESTPLNWFHVAKFSRQMREELRPAWLTDRRKLLRANP